MKTFTFLKTRHFNVFLVTFLALIMATPGIYAQLEPSGTLSNKDISQHEYPVDAYLPSPRESHAKSPAYRFAMPGFSIVQVNVDLEGMNIVGDAANEPSIAFDPNDPDRIAIGWRQFDNVASNFRQAGFGFSDNAGETWIFPGVIEPGVFRSDPVLRSDADGNFYYNSLTSSSGQYWCNVYKSENGGANWDAGVFAQGGDKQWMSIDQSAGIGRGNIYAFWTYAYSICPPDNFTRSTDGNLSYEDCSSIPSNPYWGTTMVAPNGDLYVCGAQWNGFVVAKSSNAQDPGQEVFWDFVTNVWLDGEILGFGGNQCPNPGGLLGQAIITMDSTGGPGDGNIYLLCSVERNSNSDPMDVMFSRSTDGGLTWDFPVRVNDDPGMNAYQWFGTMSVAPDGRIDVIWLDTRDNPGSVNSALYYSYSSDYGQTWSQNVRLSESFNPHVGWPNQNKMGDYLDMYSTDAGAHLAWAATFNGEQDIYYSVIQPLIIGMPENENLSTVRLSQHYPNPFTGQATISFSLKERSFVSLKVFSVNGKEVSVLVNETLEEGTHRKIFDATGLNSGVYYYRLVSGNHSETGRMMLVK